MPNLRCRIAAFTLLCAFVFSQAPEIVASADKSLRPLSGTVGHKSDPNAPLSPISGILVLRDNEFAVTLARSQGLLTLPDSSEVTLGSNTSVQVGAFNAGLDGAGSTLTINPGTIRFKIVRPANGKSNYHFTTPTSSTSVRGTQAAIASDPQEGDTIACIACKPGDVTVRVLKDNRTFSLVSGQVIRISIDGIVIGATIAAVTSQFGSAGVSLSASGTSAIAGAGAAGSAGSAAGAGAGAGTALAAAAVIAVGAVAVSSGKGGNTITNALPTPSPTPSGMPFQLLGVKKPNPTPSPSPPPRPASNVRGAR